MLAYKRIGVTVKSGLDKKDKAVKHIMDILRKLGAHICLDVKRAEDYANVKDVEPLECIENIDLLIVIGGDGTILRAFREMKDLSIPILSVNWGTVGFLAETNLTEADQLLPELLSGGGTLEERGILHVEVLRGKETFFNGYALNEAVIAQGTIARLVDLKASVNGESLTTFHADGLIISTPTGSTAYSLAAGGPVVHPTISATILTPINPHSFSQKPIVIPGDSAVEVEVLTRENKFRDTEVVLTLDGQVYVPLKHHDRVSARVYRQKVRFLRRSQDTFFSTLRAKLKWGESTER
ncbi:TPA: NAD(+) kinase [Candidatus Peribacteria bacterium]|nr:MAG: hypothetical protein A3J91_00375 [Candidatus Peribacteria bacterium RIFOXYC2_FULL_58_10]OGJ83790.1 MAG: hypothetical protein A2529_05595 [Candidatus Peribacteria bacterium RIFOXYD2_FULL_58_15]HAI98510.1 NAD(+) kinase [Candidatus Peribacteria bacterium]HAS34222.1 NAD(+) kinase [Candidatus Peribacteria bacterium]